MTCCSSCAEPKIFKGERRRVLKIHLTYFVYNFVLIKKYYFKIKKKCMKFQSGAPKTPFLLASCACKKLEQELYSLTI